MPPLREKLIQGGRLLPFDGLNFLAFAEDVSFISPSAAAAVVKNRNTIVRMSWKLATTGQMLVELAGPAA